LQNWIKFPSLSPTILFSVKENVLFTLACPQSRDWQ
jgi:hypothetical protein